MAFVSDSQKSAVNVVMGTMTFGDEGEYGTRVHDLEMVKKILDVFQSHGHKEIDTARFYGGGTSEEFLGKISEFIEDKGLKLETKLVPIGSINHTPESLRTNLMLSLKALNVSTLEMWYLHAPDRSVPYEVTLKAVNDLYKEGHFKRFGISNYAAWEVAEIVGICKANGYILPTAYQGIYNAVHRTVEAELFPCLRKFGISFYEFNPLGGGMFTGRYKSLDDVTEAGSRFDPEKPQGKGYRERYWNEAYFNAITSIRQVAEKHNLTMAEVALRWVSHHSFLSREHGDAILIGASTVGHIEQNLVDLEKGPLPEDVLTVLDQAWETAKPSASSYFWAF